MLEGRALGGGSGLGKQKESQSRYPGRTEGGALLLPRGLAAGFSARKVFSGSWHVFKHPAPLHGHASFPRPLRIPCDGEGGAGPPRLGHCSRA